jgi:hypothetical protein
MTNEAPTERADDPVYSYKPSLLGAPWQFRLRPDALEWQAGRHQGRAPYRRIARVRLSYRPSTMQTRRFLTEVWVADGPRLPIASASWRSMVEQESLEAAYGAFVRELHQRLAAAETKAIFQTGSPALLYWPGLAIVAAASLAIAVLAVRTLLLGDWAAAAIIAGFFALFAWQSVTFFYRNQPGYYRPEAVPSKLVPRA